MGESPFFDAKICHQSSLQLHANLFFFSDFGGVCISRFIVVGLWPTPTPQGKKDTSSRFFCFWPVFCFKISRFSMESINLFFGWTKLYISKQKNTKIIQHTPQKKSWGFQAATFHSSSMLALPNKKSTPNSGLVGWCRPFIPCLQDPSLLGINRKTKTSQGMPGSVGTSLVSKGWGLKIDFSSNFLMIGSPP